MEQAATEIARATRSTIGDALRRAAGRFRDRTALRFGGRRWSYRDLDRAADRVARALLAAGLERGDRVAAYGRNSDGYLLLWLGCVRAGLVHVPANYALTAAELGYILGQCGARALFFQPALAAAAEEAAAAQGVTLRGTIEEGSGPLDVLAAALDPALDSAEPPDEGLADTDLVQILYTSGTTGAPKGAMMTHRAYLHEYMGA
ncbi:MAG: AMP-binding protein, partial [Acetobacteraceae bacterium]|nr:AMP-binding protein [Acetobacteraceae bacterium]